ncbi:hypothetical protein [Micromonospora haikouensis]|uniref:hypothetical protein n=1 Tax=Micromonospora haikouensis TaxID=686309 RepID=UPI003D72816F
MVPSEVMERAEADLLAAGLARLHELLGDGWQINPHRSLDEAQYDSHTEIADMLVGLVDPSSTHAQILVEAKQHLAPSDVRRVMAPRLSLLRRLSSHTVVLVIAPWLSPKTREVLEAEGCSYLDLTGNVYIRIDRPTVLIRTPGEQRDPNPHKTRTRLAGPRAGRLVRVLTDVAPPYRATQLAAVTKLSLPYVSRLLDAMERETLITRAGRGIVEVDWPSLLRARAIETDLLRSGDYDSYIAANGISATLQKLSNSALPSALALTGSVAAQDVAPIAVGGQLIIYYRGEATDKKLLRKELGLLPTEEGANVLLLRPADDVVFKLRRWQEGLPFVALSQLAIDCLSGPGRMPAEGEAVLEFMIEHQDRWRLRDLDPWQKIT